MCNPGTELPRLSVRDLWSDGEWNVQRIRMHLLPNGISNDIVEKIAEIPIDGSGTDTARWTATRQGNFSTTSAWESIRHKQQRVEIFKIIWCPAVSPSMSVFIWRLLINRIPVDVKLQWRNIHLSSKCRCCKNPKVETREHLFILGEAAPKIWSFFTTWFPELPVPPNAMQGMEQRITWWKANMAGTDRNHVNTIIPCLILWFIWTDRNNVVHRGVTFSSNMVIERIKNHLQWAVLTKKIQTKQWKGVPSISLFKNPQPKVTGPIRSRVIKWQCPQQHWVKLNTDGAFVGGSMLAGVGGVIRYEQGTNLRGFADHSHAGSAVEAELKALLIGLWLAREFGTNIWIEVDAHEVISLTENRRRGAAELRHVLTGIRNELEKCSVKISHILREGNAIADLLAKQGRGRERCLIFDQTSAPPLVRALARMDSLGVPNVRGTNEESDEDA